MIWNHINWQGTIIQLDEMTWLLMWHELPRNAIIGLNMNERTNEQTNEWMDNTWYEYTVYGDACSQWATRACWCNSVPNNQTEATETLILWYLNSPTLILDGEQKSDLSNRYRTDPVAIGVVCSFLSSGRCCFLRQFLWFGCVWTWLSHMKKMDKKGHEIIGTLAGSKVWRKIWESKSPRPDPLPWENTYGMASYGTKGTRENHHTFVKVAT